MKKMVFSLLTSLVVVLGLSSLAQAEEDVYYVPLPVYRTGAYAAGGTGYYGGIIDYFNLLNERDGGIGGVKIVWDECETEYDRTKGIECYHRQKKHERYGEALYFDPLSVGISSALIEQGRKDLLPIISVNHGRTETERGDIFPYQFPLGSNAFDFAYAVIKHIGQSLGGMDALKGETIVTLYHGSPYGSEANDFLDILAKRYGFVHNAIEVSHPGNEQGSQWLKIRRIKPAYVFLRSWGVMTQVALQTAVRNGYDVSRLIGNEWSGSDADVLPAGKAADGYQAVTVQRAGSDFPVAEQIIKLLYNKGKGNLDNRERIGGIYWNLGIWAAVMMEDALNKAQARFGKDLSGAKVRWGLENIDITEEQLVEKGLSDVVPPIKVSCLDHTALHKVRFQQWDADRKEWSLISGWIDGRDQYSIELINKNADKYADEHPEFPPRDCADEQDRDNFDINS